MAKYSIEDSTLTAIANSIRLSKGEFSARHKVSDMASAIYSKDEPSTIGQVACLARMKQMRDIAVTPILDLPYIKNVSTHLVHPAGQTFYGVPYSSVRQTDKFIGFNVSLHTFMTALQNPKSVLYTKVYGDEYEGGNANCWYGVNCSVFVSYALGLGYHLSTAILANSELMEEIEAADIRLCDFCVSTSEGHAVFISGIVRNADGTIKTLEISEAGLYSTKISEQAITFEDFCSEYITGRKFSVFRYKRLYDTSLKPYVPVNYVPLFDEPVEDIVYSDICTNLGDKACINATETITLNPINTNGYTAIKLYRNGEEIGSYGVADVELSGLAAGKYIAKLYPEAENASTSFIVCDVTASRDGTRYYFSGTGGKPVRIVLKDNVGYTLKSYELTDEDVDNGYKDIDWTHEVLDHFCVAFENEYGFVVTKTAWAEAEPGIVLPDEYQLVEYIQSDGNQYINTLVNPSVSLSSGARYNLKVEITALVTANTYIYGALGNSLRSGNFRANTGGLQLVWYTGGSSSSVRGGTTLKSDELAVGSVLEAGYVVDNTAKTYNYSLKTESASYVNSGTYTGEATPNANIYLMYCSGVSSAAKFPGKWMEFEICDIDNNPVLHLYPCYRKADGVVGMFDIVSQTFFVNAGSGSFTKGADV